MAMTSAISTPLTLRLPFPHRNVLHYRGRPAKSTLSLTNAPLNPLPTRPRRRLVARCSSDARDAAVFRPETRPETSGGGMDASAAPEEGWRPTRFRNRFLDLARLGTVVGDAAEGFFKSEIRRRLFVTAVLIVASRIGYFVPLPGFDRRLIPENYLSFASGSVDELGDFTAELKLSLFQLGISPQIAASILMQVLCHIIPSLVKLRKEGLDGHEKIKSYMCV